jgi:hypothetical protein
MPGVITGLTPHDWTAEASGLYHTATDLKAEWLGIEAKMLAGQGGTLTAVQRLEGNAEANDIQNAVDNKTKFIGGGLDNNETAVANLLDDVILGHAPFPAVFINGKFQQLNQNGAAEDLVSKSVAGLNEAAFTRTFKASDFKQG